MASEMTGQTRKLSVIVVASSEASYRRDPESFHYRAALELIHKLLEDGLVQFDTASEAVLGEMPPSDPQLPPPFAIRATIEIGTAPKEQADGQ